MENFSFESLSQLGSLNLSLSTIVMVVGALVLAKKTGQKTLDTIKATWATMVASVPVNNAKVASGYVGAAVFGIAGATTLGQGISTTTTAPKTPYIAAPDVMYKEAMAKVQQGADPKTVDALMKEYTEAEQKRYDAAKIVYEADMERYQGNKVPGTPFVLGGIAMMVCGIGLAIRTGQKDEG